jgi:hypothetical protein
MLQMIFNVKLISQSCPCNERFQGHPEIQGSEDDGSLVSGDLRTLCFPKRLNSSLKSGLVNIPVPEN